MLHTYLSMCEPVYTHAQEARRPLPLFVSSACCPFLWAYNMSRRARRTRRLARSFVGLRQALVGWALISAGCFPWEQQLAAVAAGGAAVGAAHALHPLHALVACARHSQQAMARSPPRPKGQGEWGVWRRGPSDKRRRPKRKSPHQHMHSPRACRHASLLAARSSSARRHLAGSRAESWKQRSCCVRAGRNTN